MQRPMINKMAFGGSWLDSAKEMADKVGDSGLLQQAGGALAQGMTSSLQDSVKDIATSAASAHGAALAQGAEPAVTQATQTMKYVGWAALAVGAGVLIYFISRRKG